MNFNKQKYVRITKSSSDVWLLGESGGTSYLASQCLGQSGLEKDLAEGWTVKLSFEDRYQIVLLLERS